MRTLPGLLLLASFPCLLRARRVLNLGGRRSMGLANNRGLPMAKEKIRKAHYYPGGDWAWEADSATLKPVLMVGRERVHARLCGVSVCPAKALEFFACSYD